MQAEGGGALDGIDGDKIVVSVGILPLSRHKNQPYGVGKIYPLDQFTLDIFVFNKSSWTRRFEISYPDRRKLRKEQELLHLRDTTQLLVAQKSEGDPGILPLENRIRVGPLLPSTCQSVRMDFLALTPGVHSIDTLTLVDIQSGYTMNLRSVIDVVIHEHEAVDAIGNH